MKRVTLIVKLGPNPVPIVIDNVLAGGVPPDELHVRFTQEQVAQIIKAAADIAGERAAVRAGQFLGGALDEMIRSRQHRRIGTRKG